MNKVTFISIGIVGEEIHGVLMDSKWSPLTEWGWWRTTDLVEAAQKAVWVAQLNPAIEIEIVDKRRN